MNGDERSVPNRIRNLLSDEERLEYHGLEQRLGEAWKTFEELVRVAMERRGTDDSYPS